MENHPIPQDVTGFQFKLIGDMTVKQFAYLAAGVLSAWLIFSVFPFPGFIKFPIAIFCGALGGGLAFVPIEGRPLDVIITNFFRAVLSPNQYVFQKVGGTLLFSLPKTQKAAQLGQQTNQQKEKLALLLKQAGGHPKNKLDEKELVYFNSLSSFFGNSHKPQEPQATPVTLPT